MTKRSLFLTVAAGLLASVAFATPSRAANETLSAAFDISPSNINATEIDITLTGVPPGTGSYTVLSNGGLTGLNFAVSGDVLEITFNAANHTTPTTNPALVVTFTNPANLGITTYSITGGNTSLGYSSSGLQVSLSSVPEPASMALLGIGMTGLLAFRRLFKRPTVA